MAQGGGELFTVRACWVGKIPKQCTCHHKRRKCKRTMALAPVAFTGVLSSA